MVQINKHQFHLRNQTSYKFQHSRILNLEKSKFCCHPYLVLHMFVFSACNSLKCQFQSIGTSRRLLNSFLRETQSRSLRKLKTFS